MSGAEEVKFSLRVMINKEKTKVLFAESDSDFVDVLLGFLTLPLGRIVKVLEKHYGGEAPIIGCLNTFYNSIANLDSVHFWTEGAKLILLNPTSSFEIHCRRLKLDISDSQPEFFFCERCPSNKFWCKSMYYDQVNSCRICEDEDSMKREVAKKLSQTDLDDGVFTSDTVAFIITDDLKILPNAIGLVQTMSILDITETDNTELINATFGLNEIMNLLKASMTSQTPLSDLLLSKPRQMNSVKVESEQETSSRQIENEENPNSKKMILKVTVQKSTNRLLFAQAKDDFIEFLLSFLTIPVGGVECLLGSNASGKSIDNVHRSVSDYIDDEYFKDSDIKEMLIKPKLPHGYIPKNQILPLTEESLPASYQQISVFSSINFPKGQGNYIKGPRIFQVFDDLTVTPFYISSIICSLNQLKVPVSDVKELEMHVGLEEALSILKASITSNCALTNGLLNYIPNKQPKQET